MFFWIATAEEIEKEIESALTPMGPFIPQPFPWGTLVLAVGICAVVFFFFLTILPRLASNTLRFGGIAAILMAVALSLLLPFSIHALRSPTKVLIEAAPGAVPENVVVAETTSNSFTVEWKTQDEVVGMVKYGTAADDLTFFALDEKGNIACTSHQVVVKNLQPKTSYFFEVVSGQLRFNDQGQPLEVQTR
jgi:hypothetical protein